MEQLILSQFLLNLAGCRNILPNRNFAAEIVGRMQDSQQERQVFASDDIQVFNEMFVSCYVHSLSPLRFLALSVQFQVLVYIY